MKKIFLFIFVVSFSFLTHSCFNDDNDYDYHAVNELKGKSILGNIDGSYSISVDEKLVLKPTFKFTIDSINPDVSYEWYIDGKKTDVTTDQFEFSSEKPGSFEITVAVVDNTDGRKFSRSTTVTVRSPYLYGWCVLVNNNGKSELCFVKTQRLRYTIKQEDGKELERDSIVYRGVVRFPNLGTNPYKLIEDVGYPDADRYQVSHLVSDELVVAQDRWVELNGNTLEKAIYTDEEFGDDLPEGFAPVDASMTFSAKFILDKNGYVYLHKKPVVTDFHVGLYMPIPLQNGMKFKAIYQTQKTSSYNMEIVPACTEDNTLVAIWDGGQPDYDSPIPIVSEATSSMTGDVFEISEEGDQHFYQMDKEIVTMLPATSGPDNQNDYSNPGNPAWVALMKGKADNTYYLRYFGLKAGYGGPPIEVMDYYEEPLGAMNNYKAMAVFQNMKYVVIAEGGTLWYCQYGTNLAGQPVTLKKIKLGDMPSEVVSLSYQDLGVNLSTQKSTYNGQLGVAMADGSFRIYEVIETEKDAYGNTMGAKINMLFPNETTPEKDKNFGKIVDTLYKIGNFQQLFNFKF